MTASRTSSRQPWPCVAFLLTVASAFVVGCQPAGQGDGGQGAPPVNVQVATARLQPVSETLALVGSITADEMVEILSETDGTVESIHFREGQKVKEGHLLIQLDQTKLAASLAEAEANFSLSRANFERNQELYQERLISQQEFDQVKAIYEANEAGVHLKRRQLKDTRILAPFAGIVGARSVSPGQVITRNTTLTWLVDLDPVKLEINVPERFLAEIRVGQQLDLHVAAFPDTTFRGEIFFIAPFVDPDTRTALVKANVPNDDQKLFPGMFATLDLTLHLREQSVVVPEEAVTKLLDGGWALLYAVTEDDKADMRRVRLGVRMPGLVEVLEGLHEGDRVIIEGTQKIGPGSPVHVAEAPPENTPQSPPGDRPRL